MDEGAGARPWWNMESDCSMSGCCGKAGILLSALALW
jgi:hypothetical protein